MTLTAESFEKLQKSLPNARDVTSFDLSAINQLVEHVPEDMTATVQAGMSVATFQANLANHGQWLPIDPPQPEVTSVGALLGGNANGPRRFGFGTIRDWLIGIAVVLPDGRLVRNGGKVVKNVAGFDLCKLFVGSRGTLGVIVEATFKLLPLPESEVFLRCECESLEEAKTLIERIWASDLQPSVLDLHYLESGSLTLVLGLSGAKADVDAQVEGAHEMKINKPGDLAHDGSFRSKSHAFAAAPPDKLIEQLQDIKPFVARAGNGIYYFRGEPTLHKPSALEQRIKRSFDPKGILPAP
ncbi:MAG: hypothetical protein CMO66_03735 [Verrucomicrobiales bacterium]|mgnify:CR=1 FL=1|nr:hypothetical protein [Verrucomicrobiales bacterium]